MSLAQISKPYEGHKPLAEIGRVTGVELVGLLPEQVKEHWAVWVERLAKIGLPEAIRSREDALLQVFSHCVTGSVRCLLCVAEGEQGRALVAQALITEITGNFGGDKVLYILALQGLQEMPLDLWAALFARLRVVAKERGCTCIQANTDDPDVITLAKGLKASQYSVLEWRL
jgi:hypothetical protein